MNISIIKTEEEYQNALKKIDKLLDCEEDTPEADKLELLSLLVENYENIYYKIEAPDPIEAIKFRMEQLGLSRKDLEETIGSRARISEILNKKRKLTLSMIRKLHKILNIPADILIQDINVNLA